MLKDLQKMMKNLGKNSMFMLFAAVVLGYAVYNYSQGKGLSLSGMENDARQAVEAGHSAVDGGAGNYQPSMPQGENEEYASSSGLNTDTYGLPPSCAKQEVVNPKDLLPRDSNSEFSKLNPAGAGDLSNVSLLKAGHHIGINSVGQSLRNANLQLRSDPPNPKMEVGPWNHSTISGDPYRRPLELGTA
tara:strand:+ start:1107 stop:1670 length:564 start_codon:yes stop_codon:yes gene_type:complete